LISSFAIIVVDVAIVSSGFSSLVKGFGVAARSTRGCLLLGNFRPIVGLYLIPFLFGVERREISLD